MRAAEDEESESVKKAGEERRIEEDKARDLWTNCIAKLKKSDDA